MLYYANPCGENVRQAMRDGLLGFIDTPAQGNVREPEVDWCADNGCYSSKWDEQKWWAWLVRQDRTMRFATCPDVVGDWDATVERFNKFQLKMKAEGLPVACVAQDGATHTTIPWDDIDCVFIGGTTEFKLSATSEQIMREGNMRGVWVHVGRVNSLRRLKWAKARGADSCDGTFLTFGPDVNLPKLLRWLKEVNNQNRFDFDV